MTTPPDPRIDAVLVGFAAWLDDVDAPASHEVVDCVRPSVGYSSQTLLVSVRRSDTEGSHDHRLVLKLPPPGPAIFRTYDFTMQACVQEAVAEAGIPAPVPVRSETDDRWLGSPFLVMPAIDGHVPGEIAVFDDWLSRDDPARNAAVHGTYVDLVADINRIVWKQGGRADAPPHRDNLAELAHWRDYLAWYDEAEVPVPALVEALSWCEAHLPRTEPSPSLLWGDVRIGNTIFDDGGNLVAVLDWEMASIGAAEHDLAWTLSLQATQDEMIGRTVPGFLSHDEVVARYEARLGRAVQDLEWYEVFAMVRSTAIMTRISILNERLGKPSFLPIADNPILDLIIRRIQEANVGS